MPNRRKKSFRAHRLRKIEKGEITRLERGEKAKKQFFFILFPYNLFMKQVIAKKRKFSYKDIIR